MRVLVACEFSGIVRDAFIEHGHDAISCDLLPTERPGPHIQGDVRPLLREPWDMVIAHPPCTDLTRARGRRAPIERIGAAIDFFVECYRANTPRVAVENPVPFVVVSRFLGPPQCKVQPYQFGDGYMKMTWWWTRGLPPLIPTSYTAEGDRKFSALIASKNRNRNLVAGHLWGANNPLRSRFHPGMAAAMAQQWG